MLLTDSPYNPDPDPRTTLRRLCGKRIPHHSNIALADGVGKLEVEAVDESRDIVVDVRVGEARATIFQGYLQPHRMRCLTVTSTSDSIMRGIPGSSDQCASDSRMTSFVDNIKSRGKEDSLLGSVRTHRIHNRRNTTLSNNILIETRSNMAFPGVLTIQAIEGSSGVVRRENVAV